MSERLHELLDAYAEAFTAVGGVAGLNPPVTQAEIDEAEEILGFEIPEEALSLWRWRNGQAVDPADCEFFLHANFFPDLVRAAQAHARYLANDRFDLEPIPGLLFADGGQFSIAVVSFRQQDFGSVWGWTYFGMGDDDIHRVFDSIEEFVECHLRILETGSVERLYSESGNSTLQVPLDDERVAALDVPEAWQWMAGF